MPITIISIDNEMFGQSVHLEWIMGKVVVGHSWLVEHGVCLMCSSECST
jgi:hypothetical protein